jgi:hypothetical protein
VIVLQFVRHGVEVIRAMMVLETRASRHAPQIRQFEITAKGIVLGKPLSDRRA